jgi:hypothetical protein
VTPGVDAGDLSDTALLRELQQLHSTRHDTFRHGTDDALDEHTRRTTELESEYLRRHPNREVEPERTRQGARARDDAER